MSALNDFFIDNAGYIALISLLVTLFGVVISFVISRVVARPKIVSNIHYTALLSPKLKNNNKMEILYDGHRINNASLIEVKLFNTGNLELIGDQINKTKGIQILRQEKF